MNYQEHAITFSCHAEPLYGIASVPEQPGQRGVLIIVGGPQYRVGSHRQFTLLARLMAQRGIPVMRFDRRGMGDSEGEPRSFEHIDDDIGAAMKEFFAQIPEMKEVVIWGLCDAATAASFYAGADPRVRGLVLLNPWVRTPEGAARAMLRHYYLARLREVAFWKKVASGGLDFGASAAALRQNMRLAATERRAQLPQHLIRSLAMFKGHVMVILSGDDLTAREFAELMTRHNVRAKRLDIGDANHTFSSEKWRSQVAEASANWIMSW